MIGARVSHYRILTLLGSGGMGAVYEAEDEKLGRHVALKLLPAGMCQDQQALQRFEREARLASTLNHPNICTLYEINEWEGTHFIVMELLEGERLRDRIAGNPLSLNLLLELSLQIADALDVAHAKGVIHRDITPSNIFITQRQQAKVLDFGLAKLIHDVEHTHMLVGSSIATSPSSGGLTTPGTTMGTVAYMSPEQARGETVDARSDIFSFGAVLYEMATGKQAFGGETWAVIFDSILNRSPLPPSRLNPELPSAIDNVVAAALEKDRELRYQSAAELRADIKRLKRDIESAQVIALVPGSQLPTRTLRSSQHVLPREPDMPVVRRGLARSLLLLIQFMYLAFYLAALMKWESIHPFTSLLFGPATAELLPNVVLITAGVGIAIRLYMLSTVCFDHPKFGQKFRMLFPFVLLLDEFWALSPLLLADRISLGLAFAASAALLYLPFSQRTLVRMAYGSDR